MSSGFVSGGTADQPLEHDDEWRKAQQEIEERRRQKEEESRQGGGKSLYDILQSNKAAKEEAFQESIKLKNQFRNLDEDEVEFLDSVLESTRAKEEAVKKETSEQLELFRRQQEEADRGLLDEPKDTGDISGSPTEQSNDTQWTINARKRKRLKDEKILKGPKLLKVSSTGKESQMKPDDSTRDMPIDRESEIRTIRVSRDAPNLQENQAKDNTTPKRPRETSSESKSEAVSSSRSLPALGLADYSSEDD